MAKDPAFLFYPGDFGTGTQFFSDEQVGKYMRLLMAQHQHGHLTENQVIFICKSYDKDIMSKFSKDDRGLWYNQRLEIEMEKRKNYVLSRSKNKEGKTKEKIISKSYDPHMENENENRNVIEIKKKKESLSKIEIFEQLFSDELYVEQLAITHKGKSLNEAFEQCYTHHSNAPNPPAELWEWKQKLNTWLSISSNGNSKKGKQSTRDLATALQERINQDARKQQFSGSG